MREMLKNLAGAAAFLLVSPLIVLNMLFRSLTFFQGAGQLLAVIPGKIGCYLRMAFYRRTLTECSGRSVMEFGSYFSHWDVVVKDDVYISAYCIVARCVLEEGVMLSAYTHVLDGGHQHGIADSSVSFQHQPKDHDSYRITIGKGSWIGTKAVIMADVNPYTVVGAGAVVTRSLPGKTVVGGVPAKVIRKLSGEKAQ
jgi:acetyltransferase-like isoleucine patch superfamily enzyme